MLTTFQNKQKDNDDIIEIQPIETERINITEDEMLSMLYGVNDIDNAEILVAGS